MRKHFFFSSARGRGRERQLWVDDKTQKCIRFHGSVTPTNAHYTSALCFKRNLRLSYAWPAKPLNCWSGVSSWIKSSVPWIKGRNALNAQILSLATGTQALWLLKCTALKWKGLFLASVLFHSAPAHLGVNVICRSSFGHGHHIFYVYIYLAFLVCFFLFLFPVKSLNWIILELRKHACMSRKRWRDFAQHRFFHPKSSWTGRTHSVALQSRTFDHFGLKINWC